MNSEKISILHFNFLGRKTGKKISLLNFFYSQKTDYSLKNPYHVPFVLIKTENFSTC